MTATSILTSLPNFRGTKVQYERYVDFDILPCVNAQPYVAVVDDESSVCRAFARLLRSAQFDVATFASGSAFLTSLASRTPDCVVLDLQMPGMTGFDVQSRLAADPTTHLEVIIVTAQDTPESRQRAIAGGAIAYLRKPIDARPLLDAICSAIAHKANWH